MRYRPSQSKITSSTVSREERWGGSFCRRSEASQQISVKADMFGKVHQLMGTTLLPRTATLLRQSLKDSVTFKELRAWNCWRVMCQPVSVRPHVISRDILWDEERINKNISLVLMLISIFRIHLQCLDVSWGVYSWISCFWLRFDMKHGIASDEMFDIMEPHPKYVTKIQMKRIKTWKPSWGIGNIQTTQSLSGICRQDDGSNSRRTFGIWSCQNLWWRLRWCECFSLGGVDTPRPSWVHLHQLRQQNHQLEQLLM